MMIATNGIELAWEESGGGEPLLWLHGFMGCGADWHFLFPAPPEGFRLIAPDLPGQGASTGRAGPYSFRASAEDVLALLDYLGIDRVKIIGLSGGGITALHIAVLTPSRVSHMVVISAPASFPKQARALQRQFSEAMIGEAEMQRMRERHTREGQFAALVAQSRALADGNDPDFTPADLAKITADTLIVFGDRDPLYPVSCAMDLRNGIPRSWLWVVPNGGHGPIFGAAAPAFRETALPFLNGAWT